ncbi:MAG TPA: recombinase family protein [Planctomycetota bacterium]|nr:recombinase family protein [Planctomycetota bacterium]
MTATSVHRRSRVTQVEVPAISAVRVALYTRKSTEKGLDQAFNSIDAQREMLEGFVAGRAAEGWTALPARYDDGGYSGGNTNRPGLQRLQQDIGAGLVDKVAVYRLDRLSRHTGDFVALMDFFRRHRIEVVSPNERVEQATASDRLTLGVRMQVSQFEREIAAERIRDKMRAARAKGLWQGGRPVLGYDVVAKKLVVNPAEAADVRAVFGTYARTTSIVATLAELERRGIRLKSWTTQRGRRNEGRRFRDHSLRTLLANPLYVGRLYAGDEVVDAQHEAIVPRELWDEVQALLALGQREQAPRRAWGALLTGVIHCAVCGSAMVPSYCKKGDTRYGYYVCQSIKARGAAGCPGSRISQATVEAEVVERIRAMAREPALLDESVRAARAEVEARRRELAADAQRAGTEAARLQGQIDDLVARGADVPEVRRRLDALREAHDAATERATAAKDEAAGLRAPLDEGELCRAIESFAAWNALFPDERARLVRLVVARVVADGRTGDITIKSSKGGRL